MHARHRGVEFKKFLERIDAEVPVEPDVHLILDALLGAFLALLAIAAVGHD